MSEEQEVAQGELSIQKIYIEDVSVESPATPAVFKEQWQPDANIELNTQSDKLEAENTYKVTLTLTVTAKSNDKTAFLIEVKQAGIFGISGFEEAQLGHVLGSYCPSTLFPYAREAVSNLVTRAGFPDLQLAPINFDALYMQGLEEAATAE